MDIFSNLDPTVKILSLGISGFCFLLVIMAYRMISVEQQRDVPRKSILTSVYVFMGINFMNVLVVGVLGLPAISRNVDLQKTNQQTGQQLNARKHELAFIQKSNEWAQDSNTGDNGRNPASTNNESFINTDDYQKALDSLHNSYVDTGSPLADSLKNYKEILAKDFVVLKSDTTSTITKNQLLKRINETNRILSYIILNEKKQEK